MRRGSKLASLDCYLYTKCFNSTYLLLLFRHHSNMNSHQRNGNRRRPLRVWDIERTKPLEEKDSLHFHCHMKRTKTQAPKMLGFAWSIMTRDSGKPILSSVGACNLLYSLSRWREGYGLGKAKKPRSWTIDFKLLSQYASEVLPYLHES